MTSVRTWKENSKNGASSRIYRLTTWNGLLRNGGSVNGKAKTLTFSMDGFQLHQRRFKIAREERHGQHRLLWVLVSHLKRNTFLFELFWHVNEATPPNITYNTPSPSCENSSLQVLFHPSFFGSALTLLSKCLKNPPHFPHFRTQGWTPHMPAQFTRMILKGRA